MRLKLFENINPSTTITTAGSVLFCVAALAASLWSLKDLADDENSSTFMLDSYEEQFGRQASDENTLYFNFGGSSY